MGTNSKVIFIIFGGGHTRLTNFFLTTFWSFFIGGIPESFGQLGNLVELNLSSNKLEGQLFSIFEAVSAH